MAEPKIPCPSCGAAIASTDRFCASCGASLALAADAPTVDVVPSGRSGGSGRGDAPPGGTPGSGSSRASWLSSSASGTGARFAPGAILGGRYRIIGLLGRGGMGEVYRADDLTLDQAVALKFLPESLARDEDRRARFFGEVRTARQVSHPNVCRVHDIGEIEGLLYLSMEYVDGEDLSSLLRRIGRLPGDKALEIARQLCAGLAAAHDKGVLHRDLKPANVMIDGQGKVRLTDFGLASAIDDLAPGDVRAGTPAYMAPEQLAGREVTHKSDIYAVGLVLYELLTGKRTFSADTLAELTAMHTSKVPESPSSIQPDMDHAVEAVILRCLEKDPAKRPASALAVAAALPGGDPLAAALAAGETPSPELVAAAGESSALSPGAAWGLFGAFVLLVAGFGWLSEGAQLFTHISPDRSPDVLAARSREILESAGYPEKPADTAQGFSTDFQLVNRIVAERRNAPDYWHPLLEARPQPIFYWYRESPRTMNSDDADGRINYGDPPLLLSDMARVRLDMSGRLVELDVVPPQIVADTSGAAVDWPPLFARAGLEMERFVEIDPIWTPQHFADELRSWRGTYAEAPNDTVRVDAGGYGGRPVHFDVVGDWEWPSRQVRAEAAGSFRLSQAISLGILLSTMLLAVVLVRRNVKLGRGDIRGAFRIAGFVAACNAVAWAISAHHPAALAPFVEGLFLAIGNTLFTSGLIWLVYVALEPYVRKRWPHRLVTWSRIVGGRLRDPRVGRDVLVGCVVGAGVAVIDALHVVLPPKLGVGGALPFGTSFRALLGVDQSIAVVLDSTVNAVVNGLVFIFLPLIFYLVFSAGRLMHAVHLGFVPGLGRLTGAWARLVVRHAELFGVVLFGLLVTGIWIGRSPLVGVSLAVGGVEAALFLGLMMRGGLLPLTSCFVIYFALIFAPVSLDVSAWYAGSSIAAAALVVALGGYGFVVASGGRPSVAFELGDAPAAGSAR